MAEYIEREAAIKSAIGAMHGVSQIVAVDMVEALEGVPAADVVEVRRGEWIDYESDETYGPYESKEWYKCSCCGNDAHGRCDEDPWYSYPILSDYCSFCGAKMDGKGDNNG